MSERNALLTGASPLAITHSATTGPLMTRGAQITYNTDEGGALTVEQATQALLTPQTVSEDAPEPDAGDAGGDEDFSDDDAQGDDDANEDQSEVEISDDDDTSEAEEPGDGEEEAEEEVEPVEALTPPAYWSKDAKAKFAELTPELQAVVLSQEGPREAATAKAKQEAAEEVKAARAQLAGVQTLAQQLETFLPEALETFQQRWGEPDWEATIKQYGAEQAAILRARYDKEQSQLAHLATTTQKAKAEAHQAFMLEQFEVLSTLDPELAPDVKDPRKGSELRKDVVTYLAAAGVDQDSLAQISAVELSLAKKAMLWDRAQEAAKAKKKAAPAQPVQRQQPVQQRRVTPKPGARPAGSAASSPQSGGRVSSQNAFNSKPSVDNAVALLLARSAKR